MTSTHHMSGVAGVCSEMMDVFHAQRVCQARSLAAGLIACRHNAARVSMTPFSSAEMYAESMFVIALPMHRKLGQGFSCFECYPDLNHAAVTEPTCPAAGLTDDLEQVPLCP